MVYAIYMIAVIVRSILKKPAGMAKPMSYVTVSDMLGGDTPVN